MACYAQKTISKEIGDYKLSNETLCWTCNLEQSRTFTYMTQEKVKVHQVYLRPNGNKIDFIDWKLKNEIFMNFLAKENVEINESENMSHRAKVKKMIFKGSYKEIPLNLFRQYPNIQYLQIDQRRVGNLTLNHFENADKLEYIFGFNNNITTLNSHVFSNAPNLKVIELTTNRNLKKLQPKAFSGLFKLTHLNLFDNRIEDIGDGILDDLVLLEHLNLSDNRIKSLPGDILKYLVNLQTLYLNGLSYDHLPVKNDLFENLHNIQYLSFNLNDLNEIDKNLFQNLSKLEYLALIQSSITEISDRSFENLKNLTTLFLNYGQIRSISALTFEGLTNLQTLELTANQIVRIETKSFSALPNLMRLEIESNDCINDKNVDLKVAEKVIADSECASCVVPNIENGVLRAILTKKYLKPKDYFRGDVRLECDEGYSPLLVGDDLLNQDISCKVEEWNKEFPKCLSNYLQNN